MAKKTDKTSSKKTTDLRKVPRAERPAPTTGQSGSKLTLAWDELNKDEQKVVRALADATLSIADIAKTAKLKKLQVRNGLRRPVRATYVRSTDRGVYTATAYGMKMIDTKTAPASTATSAVPSASKKTATATKKVVKAKATTVKVGAIEVVDLENLNKWVKAAMPNESQDSPRYKSALIALAVEQLGHKDTVVAKALGMSRGFVIPRVKRLKALKGPLSPITAESLSKYVAVAEGR